MNLQRESEISVLVPNVAMTKVSETAIVRYVYARW